MKEIIPNIPYLPKVGSLDKSGVIYFELELTPDEVVLYEMHYNIQTGEVERKPYSQPIFTYSIKNSSYEDRDNVYLNLFSKTADSFID